MLSDTKQADTHHGKSVLPGTPEILMVNNLAMCGWDWGRVTPRILVLLCPLSPSVPVFSLPCPVLFSVPLCLVLSSLRQSHQVYWVFVEVLTVCPSYCTKAVYTQQSLSGVLGGSGLRTLLRTKPGFSWSVLKEVGLGTQGPTPVGKFPHE